MTAIPRCAQDEWGAARPDVDLSSMAIVGPMKRAQALIDLGLEQFFEAAEVPSPELDLLVTLRHTEGPVIARHLMRITNRSAAGISKMLRKLEARGLIEKQPSQTDRRSTLVSITERGCEVVDSLFPRQLALEAQLLSRLSAEDRESVISALNTLVAALEKTGPAGG